jgi:hypothetical protein
MAHGVDDDLCLADLVENEIGIRICHQAANDRIIRADANIRIDKEQVDDCLNRAWTRFAPCGEWVAV